MCLPVRCKQGRAWPHKLKLSYEQPCECIEVLMLCSSAMASEQRRAVMLYGMG